MSKFLEYALLRGQIIPFKDANISIATHALHYGTSAFGGMRTYINKNHNKQLYLFRSDLHIKRLSNSAKMLGHDLPEGEIKAKITKFIRANKGDKSYYLRPLVYVSDLGLTPKSHDVEFDLLLYGVELGDYLNKDGISVCFSPWMKTPSSSIPATGKIGGGYVNSSLAKTDAHKKGFDEAILLNMHGNVAEGSSTNIFLVKDGKLITPDLESDILEGITRRSVMEIARDLEIKIEERKVDKTELFSADEVFMCGTAAQITPVNIIDNQKLPSSRPVTNKLSGIIQDILAQKSNKYADWLQPFETA